MKEFIISEAKVETAVLVGLITQMQDEGKRTSIWMNWRSLPRRLGRK